MPAFTDTFGSVGNWALEAGSDTGHFVADSSPPAGFCDDENAGQIIYSNPGPGTFAYSRLDLVDGGVPANTAWIAYAVYVADWNELWMGGAGAGSNAKIPGHAYNSNPNTQSGNGFPAVLTPTSATTGTLSGSFTGPVALSHQAWHTVRLGTRIDGVNSTEELWLDGVQVDTFSGNSGITTGSFGPMFWDEDTFYTNANVYLQELTWNPSVDPGEPQCAAIPPNGGGAVCALYITLDGVDVTDVSLTGSITRRLNRPALATIRIPMDAAIGGAGSRLMVSLDAGSNPFFHGMVMDCEVDGGEDFGYVTYNASDPMELWQWRPARDPDGDFTNPDFIETFQTGPQIIETLLQNTEGDSTAQGNPLLTPPSEAEGPTFLTFGSFEAGGLSIEGAPVDWPMTIAQIASLLTSTGELDIVITPTDPGGGIMGTVDCYNGDYGINRSPFGGGSGEVLFSYGMGALNVRAMRWNEDMATICNKLWYYGGPRIKTARDPEGSQHWCWNVTGDDPDLYGNISNEFGALQGGPFASAGPGGALPTSGSYVGGVLGDMRQDSQDGTGTNGVEYGVRMEVRVWDAASDLCGSKLGVAERWLYRAQWQAESWARVYPRELIHITPIRGTEIGTFDIGDLVGVECTSTIRGGFSGAQRVYEYTISWDEDGPCQLSELQTSSDTGIPTP